MRSNIIIIGAGIAGLAAYHQLAADGFTPLILEARSECGGRIAIDHSFGFPIGRGAGWIHGVDGNPITQLATQFNVTLATPNQHIKYDRHGKPISLELIQAFEEKFSSLLQQAKKIAFSNFNDVALSSILSELIPHSSFSSIEEDLFKNKLQFFEGYIGADYFKLSARDWDREETWPGDNCFLVNTYENILHGLTRDCNIQCNTTVKSISIFTDRVEIAAEHSLYQADAVIVTLPLGVLKSGAVAFHPTLPEIKLNAIQRMGMGLLNVSAFTFPTVFWPEECDAMSFTQFDATSISTFFNLHKLMHKPVLMGYAGGDRARTIEQFNDVEVIEKTVQNLQGIFGAAVPYPENFFITRWASDPLSYGAYSYPAVGTSDVDYLALAQPVSNRLFFAGEATSLQHFATTHGAYLTGIREAKRIKEIYQFSRASI